MKIFEKIRSSFNFSGNKKKIMNNLIWAVLGKVINLLSGLFVGILVARYLGAEDFGMMSYVISFVAIFQVFAAFGLENIEIRELAKENADVPRIMGTSFVLRFGFALITILAIYITLLIFESDPQTFILVLIYSISIIFLPTNVIRNYFTSIVQNEYVVKTEIARTMLGAGIKILLLALNAPLIFFVISTTFDFVLVSTGYLISLNRKIGLNQSWKFDKNLAVYLLKQSFPLLLSASAVIIYQRIDLIILKRLMDNSAVGLYSVATRIIEIGIFIPVVISQTVAPLLVKEYAKSKDAYLKKRQQYMDIILWSSIIVSFMVFLLAKPVVSFLFGEQYLASIPVLKILAWKIALMAFFNFSAQIIIIEGIHKLVVIRNLVACGVSIGLNYLLIPKYGIVGSAWASTITFFISGYLAHLFIPKYKTLFFVQSKSLVLGWKELLNLRKWQ